MFQLTGFAPDSDPAVPGTVLDCAGVIPNEVGLRAAPTPASVGASALPAECRGAANLSKLNGTRRLLAGTEKRLYELSGQTWNAVDTAATLGTYVLGAEGRWAFAQLGDTTLAATISEKIKQSASGTFTTITGAPLAALVESASGFALAFNTSTSSDEWACSAYLDPTDWTPSVTTQSASGRLVGGAGPITAARRFGDDVIAYKAGAMFHGRYVGAPAIWQWTQVSNDVGCVGQDAVVDTPAGHVFVGRENLYIYDGSVPKAFGSGVVRDWLINDMNPAYQYRTRCLFDRGNQLVWIFYPSVASSTPDHCVVYHLITGKFGRADNAIEAVTHYVPGAFSYDSGYPTYTYEAGPLLPFDSAYWLSGKQSPAVFTTSHVLSVLGGAPTTSSITTGDFGADDQYSMCRALRVRYLDAPASSTATGYTKMASGDLVAVSSSAGQSDGRHPLRQTARWHRFKVDMTGDWKATGIGPELVGGGRR